MRNDITTFNIKRYNGEKVFELPDGRFLLPEISDCGFEFYMCVLDDGTYDVYGVVSEENNYPDPAFNIYDFEPEIYYDAKVVLPGNIEELVEEAKKNRSRYAYTTRIYFTEEVAVDVMVNANGDIEIRDLRSEPDKESALLAEGYCVYEVCCYEPKYNGVCYIDTNIKTTAIRMPVSDFEKKPFYVIPDKNKAIISLPVRWENGDRSHRYFEAKIDGDFIEISGIECSIEEAKNQKLRDNSLYFKFSEYNDNNKSEREYGIRQIKQKKGVKICAAFMDYDYCILDSSSIKVGQWV